MEGTDGKKTFEKELSVERKEKLKQFRERVSSSLKPGQDDDTFLVRWLIARDFDVDKAEQMLKKHLKFQKANSLDVLRESKYKPSEVFDYMHMAVLGYDNEGCLVRFIKFGAWDLKGICASTTKDECVTFLSYFLQNDYSVLEKQKNSCGKQVFIIDLDGMSWTVVSQKIVYERVFVLLRIYEANHPGKLEVAYIINAPMFFGSIYNWFKTFLPESLMSKMKFVSQEEFHSRFVEHIDPSIIPASIGGSRVDPDGDPTCKSLFPKPLDAVIPENLMPTEKIEALKNDPEAKTITVGSSSVFTEDIVVQVANTNLTWTFLTLDYDIRMGLRYKQDENSKAADVIPNHRVDSHIIPESGNFICENPGTYELFFDNTYSWMTSKQLIFKINLITPS